nr:uncharacterized protein LOC120973581 [Aegilops tauschii subsp. strangulata]
MGFLPGAVERKPDNHLLLEAAWDELGVDGSGGEGLGSTAYHAGDGRKSPEVLYQTKKCIREECRLIRREREYLKERDGEIRWGRGRKIGVLKQSPAGCHARRSGRGRRWHGFSFLSSPSHHPSLYLLQVQEELAARVDVRTGTRRERERERDLDGVDRWAQGGASSVRCGVVVVAGEHGGEHPERQRGLLGGDLQRLREHRGTQVPGPGATSFALSCARVCVEVGLRRVVLCGGVVVAGEHGGERPERQRVLVGWDMQRLREHGGGRGRGGYVGAPRRLHESEGRGGGGDACGEDGLANGRTKR